MPVAIGVKKFFDLRRPRSDIAVGEHKSGGLGNALSVAGVTMANGGDNIGTYAPAFATRSIAEVALIVLVFAAMVAVWLAVSHWLVNHPALGAPIRRYGHIITPFVLIALGLFILYEARSFSLLARLSTAPTVTRILET